MTAHLEATIELLRRRRARQSLIDFAAYTKPEYEVWWHHRLLAGRVDALLSGEINRLAVFMPPRHGKSELVSRRLPAFAIGRNPDLRIIACSHTSSLAESMSRDAQRVMLDDRYGKLFPGVELPLLGGRQAKKRTNELFEWQGGSGHYRSAGVGGAITGVGFDLGIIDDPIKSREQADSPAYREKVWEWYASDFYSRRQANAKILLTLTRWHRDDLAGRLIRKMADRDGDQWEVISLPGIRKGDEQGDGDGKGASGAAAAHPDDPRKPGEALWPTFMDAAEHKRTKDQDPRSYAALYGQDPAEAAGAEWPPSYFGDWIWHPVNKWPGLGDFGLRVVVVDPSKGKDAKTHDYSAIVFVGVGRDGLVYVDADMERRPPHKIVRDTLRMCDRYKPDMVGIEANQFQELLVDDFERATQQTFSQRHPVYKIFNRINKVVRIRRIGPYLVNRELRFKSDSPGCRILVEQLIDFPLADHDDGPDALEMALRLPVEVGGGGGD